MTSSWVWECPWALEKCELESLSGEKNLSHHQIHPRTFSSQQSCRVDWAMKGAVKVGVTFHFHSLSLLHQMTNLPMCITWKFHKHCPPEIPPSWPFFTTSPFFFFFFNTISGPDIHHGQGIWTNLRETLPNKSMWLKQMDAICQLARIVGKGHPKGNKFWE